MYNTLYSQKYHVGSRRKLTDIIDLLHICENKSAHTKGGGGRIHVMLSLMKPSLILFTLYF